MQYADVFFVFDQSTNVRTYFHRNCNVVSQYFYHGPADSQDYLLYSYIFLYLSRFYLL